MLKLLIYLARFNQIVVWNDDGSGDDESGEQAISKKCRDKILPGADKCLKSAIEKWNITDLDEIGPVERPSQIFCCANFDLNDCEKKLVKVD